MKTAAGLMLLLSILVLGFQNCSKLRFDSIAGSPQYERSSNTGGSNGGFDGKIFSGKNDCENGALGPRTRVWVNAENNFARYLRRDCQLTNDPTSVIADIKESNNTLTIIATGEVLDADGFSSTLVAFNGLCARSAGGVLSQDSCSTQGQTSFIFHTVAAGTYTISPLLSQDTCLADAGVGTPIAGKPCTGSTLQTWALIGSTVSNVGSRFCMNVAYSSTAAGANLITWNCDGGLNEVFILR